MAGQCVESCGHEEKKNWLDGPWQREPDRVEFEAAGLPCLLHRSRIGMWCGYVAVPPGHPWHGKEYDSIDVEVHGGLTYSDACTGPICHVPRPGEPDDVWWFGFDCGHAWDLAPGMLDVLASIGRPTTRPDEVYRDLEYVRAETVRLAEQLVTMGHGAKIPEETRSS